MSAKKILYLECAAGISGDMFVAAMADLGADRNGMLEMLKSLRLDGVEYQLQSVVRSGFAAKDFSVILPGEHHHHHHDHHDHDHDHHHHHEHRNLADALEIIRRSTLTPRAYTIAEKIFTIVAEAEASVHGKPVEEVHFHEVGALDSIADIAAAAYCIDALDIGETVIPALSEGTGTVQCAHGELQVPVPAVLKIAERFSIPLRITDEIGEMTTPTGIAIAAALRTSGRLPEVCTICKTGLGSGKKTTFKRPNLLRAVLLEDQSDTTDQSDRIALLETNVDDCTGEELGLAFQQLMDAGAKDVHTIPVYMKKNRPGWLLRVICDPADVPQMEQIIFAVTGTIGLRKQLLERTCLTRRTADVTLPAGTVAVKRSRWQNGVICAPEYESVRRLSEETGIPFRELYQAAKTAAEKEENTSC